MIDGSVCLAYVHGPEVAHSWHLSVVELLNHDVRHEQRIVHGGMLGVRCKSGAIMESRNHGAERFLAGDAEWLLWADTDMGFAADTVDRLVAAAHPVERPIVGALCFGVGELGPDGLGGWRTAPAPTLFRWIKEGDGREGYATWADYPAGQLVSVAATGSAMILIHRDVLTKIGNADGPNWYLRVMNETTGQLMSEDLSFCWRAAAHGFPIHVDTRVKTSHMKTVWVGEPDHRWAGHG